MRRGFTFALVLLLLGTFASDLALARGSGRSGGPHGAGIHGGKHFHGRHFHGQRGFGVFVGVPWFIGGWGYASPYYYPSSAYYPTAPYYPPAYIEQAPALLPAPAYWYYCPDTRAYYPYVKECLGGWQQVIPQAPPPS